MVWTWRVASLPSGVTRAIPPWTRWRRPESKARQRRAVAASSALGSMRRPQATTVSAPSTNASGWRAATARALAAARRIAWSAGSSCLSGVSSRAAGSTASGSRATWRNSSRRRGEAEARTRRCEGATGRFGGDMPRRRLLEAEGDTAFGEVVGRHLDIDLVAGKDADAILAHLARGVREHLVVVVQLDAKHRVGQQLRDRAGEFYQILFRHPAPIIFPQQSPTSHPGQKTAQYIVVGPLRVKHFHPPGVTPR